MEFYFQLELDDLYAENHLEFAAADDEHGWLLKGCSEIRMCPEALRSNSA